MSVSEIIEIETIIDCDISTSSIEGNIIRLSEHRPSKGRVFFIVFTHAYRAFAGQYEETMNLGYDAVFFAPSEEIPDIYAWDQIMYSCETSMPISRIKHRPPT